jgi:hypothetical protein
MVAGVEDLSAKLSATPAVVEGLEAVLTPVRQALELPAPAGDAVRFLPEGGSVSGLQPVVDLADGAGFLPLRRHGSTMAALLGAAEVLAAAGHAEAVVALDDFADALDAASAERLAGLLRAGVGQLWLSTRRPETARSFAPDELIRLSLADGHRSVHHARTPTSKHERLAARHLHRQLLPAMTARGGGGLRGHPRQRRPRRACRPAGPRAGRRATLRRRRAPAGRRRHRRGAAPV